MTAFPPTAEIRYQAVPDFVTPAQVVVQRPPDTVATAVTVAPEASLALSEAVVEADVRSDTPAHWAVIDVATVAEVGSGLANDENERTASSSDSRATVAGRRRDRRARDGVSLVGRKTDTNGCSSLQGRGSPSGTAASMAPWDHASVARLGPSAPAWPKVAAKRWPVAAYNHGVSRLYTLRDADAIVPEIAAAVQRLRDQREEVVALQGAIQLREAAPGTGAAGPGDDDPELLRLRLRTRGLVDQMQADAAWLDARSIVLRDISTGLLDFPAEANGRPIWLCWRLGESSVVAWHPYDEGFSGRRPIEELR